MKRYGSEEEGDAPISISFRNTILDQCNSQYEYQVKRSEAPPLQSSLSPYRKSSPYAPQQRVMFEDEVEETI